MLEINHGLPSLSIQFDRRRIDASSQISETQEKGLSYCNTKIPYSFHELKLTSYQQKKALQALKAPKVEPEKTPALKRPAEARDAREVAKKLLKSGAISAIPKPSEKTETTGFKRSRGLERKLSSSERAPSGFQPFSASQGSMVSNEEHIVQEARPKNKVECGSH